MHFTLDIWSNIGFSKSLNVCCVDHKYNASLFEHVPVPAL